MSVAEVKSLLHQLIVETDDVDLLLKFRDICVALKSQSQDWADSLSIEQARRIQQGLKDAEEGRLISHEEMRKRIDLWIEEKKNSNG